MKIGTSEYISTINTKSDVNHPIIFLRQWV